MDQEVPLAQILENLRFSAPLPTGFVKQLASKATLRDYAAGETLFRENSQNNELMIIASGSVALEVYVPGRGPIPILTLGPGDMVAWSALLGGGRMTTSAVALHDTKVVAIPAHTVFEWCDKDHTLGYHLMHKVATALAERLVATRLQLLDVFADSPPDIRLTPKP